MASVLRWFSRIASRLCCGGEIVKKDEFEAYPEGSLAGDGEHSLDTQDELSGENQSKYAEEDPGHATNKGRKATCPNKTTTGDVISTLKSKDMDPTAACGDDAHKNGSNTISGANVKDIFTTEEHSIQGDVHSAECESFPRTVAILEEDCPRETASEDRMRIHYKVLEYKEDTREFTPVRPDVFVCTEGKEYSVHSRVLTRFSEFFRLKLEGREGLDSVVFLPSESVSAEALETLLRFVYYGILLFSNRQKIEAVGKASQYLGIGGLEKMLCMQK